MLLCFAFDLPPVTAPSIAACVGLWLAPVWREARQDAEASSVRPGMACRWTPTQARSAGDPSSRFCFCDEGRSCRVAALFGYFLRTYIHNVPKGVTYDGQAENRDYR